MKVRAIKFGFYLHQRQPGDEFDFEGKPSEKWMEPVDDAAREAFKKAGFKVQAAPPPASQEDGKGPKGKGPKGKGDEKPAPAGAKGAGSTGDQEVI